MWQWFASEGASGVRSLFEELVFGIVPLAFPVVGAITRGSKRSSSNPTLDGMSGRPFYRMHHRVDVFSIEFGCSPYVVGRGWRDCRAGRGSLLTIILPPDKRSHVLRIQAELQIIPMVKLVLTLNVMARNQDFLDDRTFALAYA
jgi:hypothetical protein